MNLTINGDPKTFSDVHTLADLLAQLNLTPTLLACEVNETLVPKADHVATILKDGDRVEIIRMIGGG